jgi:quercetin dioxygenase-like cupin family protein
MSDVFALDRFPIHLGLGATACPQPEFTGAEWYEAYGTRSAEDGPEGRLVTVHHFDANWSGWEMHPLGDEVVYCIAGKMTLIQELADGRIERIPLTRGEYSVNPRGVWHTADIASQAATALFITAGAGTRHRPR